MICCEPLSSLPVGTTVPCGHVFHVDCFGEWGARSASNSDLKCPICNGICLRQQPFVRIFVNLAAAAADMCESDDGSLNSDDSDNNTVGIGTSQLEAPHFPYDVDVLEVPVKVVEGDPKKTIPAISTNRNIDCSTNRYKRKAKVLKSRVKQLERLREEFTDRARSLETTFKELKAKSDTVNADMQHLTEENKNYRLELQEAKVALRRNVALLEKYKKEANDFKQQAAQVSAALHAVQEGHQQALRAAQSTSLAEVRELRRDHTVLSTEHRIINQQLAKRNDQILQLQRRVKELEAKVGDRNVERNDLQRENHNDLQAHRRQAIAVSQYKSQWRQGEERDIARGERKELQQKMSVKGTALAARICRATEKKIVSSTANQVLDVLDRNVPNKKRHVEPSIQIRIEKTTPSFVKRKDALVVKNSAAPKRNVQNDIRDMFRS